MNLYKYTGKSEEGKIIIGEIEADSEAAAAKLLSSRKIIPIAIEDGSKDGLVLFNRVSLKDKVVITRQLATMINAGLPIAQSLKTLETQTDKKNIKSIMLSAMNDVEGGAQLSVAFARFPDVFTQLDITLIASGETSGSLDKSLLQMADQLEKQQSLTRKIRSALIYPIFVLVVVVAVVFVMVTYVMPQMEGLYASFGSKLPFLTRVMISMSHFLTRWSPLVILLIVGFTIYTFYSLRTPAGRRLWDNTKLHIPAIKDLLIKLYMARFSRTLSGLVSSGVALLDSLSIVSRSVGNVIYQEKFVAAAKKVESGVALSETLSDDPLFPPVVPQMISVGEKTGEMSTMLSNLADYYEEEVDVAVKNISGLIEPILILVLGGVVVIVLLAIMQPLYQIGKIV